MGLSALKKKALADPAVKAEYAALDEEFELISTLITMREKSGLTQGEIANGDANPEYLALGVWSR